MTGRSDSTNRDGTQYGVGSPRAGFVRLGRAATFIARLTVTLTVVLILCIGIDFLRFVEQITALQPPENPKADAIVVLTGGAQRIDQAVELLKTGAGERLLISGVHPATTGNQIARNTQSSQSLFECCVDIGHQALDTIGNANETVRWIRDNAYRKVLVVTTNYHMPRSLQELRRVDNQTDFVPYPVVSSDLKARNWLRDPAVLRAMLLEYFKITLASLRDLAGSVPGTGLRTDGLRGSHSAGIDGT